VAIARALAVGPQVILADEPISMLDVSIRMGVLNLMEGLKESLGLAYLYITHDIASARYIGDQTIVMYAGYMVEGANSEELTLSLRIRTRVFSFRRYPTHTPEWTSARWMRAVRCRR